MYMFGFRELIIVFSLLALFAGCSSSDADHAQSVSVKKNFAILGPIQNGRVEVLSYPDATLLMQTTTLPLSPKTQQLRWDAYSVGSFDLNSSALENEGWLLLFVSGGEDVDSDDDGRVDSSFIPLEGSISLLFRPADAQKRLIVNPFSTIGVALVEHKDANETIQEVLDGFADKLFACSIDGDNAVDYHDLFAYIPNVTESNCLVSESVFENLHRYGVIDQMRKGGDLYAYLQNDEDGDGLTLLEEILSGTSPKNSDSDGDGIPDSVEISKGYSPISKDSDDDGLWDNVEERYGTSVTNPDTDEDYLPDGVEIAEGGDPLQADEDGNGIVDGLDGDPFFKYQWYIKSEGDVIVNTADVATIKGNDLDILDIYHNYLGGSDGNKTVVQVVDTGVEADHEDLEIDWNNSFNAVNHTHDPTATQTVGGSLRDPIDIGHGTAVAGILGAKTNNGVGIRGIVPRAKIAGSNFLENATLEEAERAWLTEINASKVRISSNSWGAYIFDDPGYERILKLAVEKGRIFVFASGNFREEYGNANLSYVSNNPYAITVAALNHLDTVASYSNPGSNVLVSAYGGEHYYSGPTIMSTLLMGKSFYASEIPPGQKGSITVDEDRGRNYTYAMNGTSAATPMVSGIIALTLQACPNLSYRDIRWLIAHTAKRVDKQNSTWVQNAAGLWHSIDYGYGKINAKGMIALCKSRAFQPLGALRKESLKQSYNEVIPDTNTTIIKEFEIKQQMKVEWVSVTAKIDHPFAGDLEIALVSPSGTRSVLLTLAEVHYNAFLGGFRFSSVAFADEPSQGKWKIEITDRLENDAGFLKELRLEVLGH